MAAHPRPDDIAVGRRHAIQAGVALAGLTAVSLPAAASASSYVATVSAAPSYAAGDVLLAGWSAVNTALTTYPLTAQTIDSSLTNDNAGGPGGTAVHGFGGDTTTNYSTFTAMTRGIFRDNDNRNWWYTKNPDVTLNLNAAGAPYLQFSITAGQSGLRLSSFFAAGATITGKVSARVSTNGYSTALREGPGPTGGYKNYVVNLTGMPAVQAGQTVSLRLYFFDTAPFGTGAAYLGGGQYQAFDPVLDAYNSLQASRSTGFIGRTGTA